MHIYLKNKPAEFHPYPIWNDGIFINVALNKKNNKMSSDMRSVPDQKIEAKKQYAGNE